jgi:hypothetical protein
MFIDDDAFLDQGSTQRQSLLSIAFGHLYPVVLTICCFTIVDWYFGWNLGDELSSSFYRAVDRMISHLSIMTSW